MPPAATPRDVVLFTDVTSAEKALHSADKLHGPTPGPRSGSKRPSAEDPSPAVVAGVSAGGPVEAGGSAILGQISDPAVGGNCRDFFRECFGQ